MNFSRIGKYLLIPFAIIISFIPVIDPFNLFNNLKNSAFDIFQNISPRESISAESVLILDIDEESLSKLGQWPWPRTILSDLVDKTYLSAVLGFDVVFAENDRCLGSNGFTFTITSPPISLNVYYIDFDLKSIVSSIKKIGSKVSLFIDPSISMVDFALDYSVDRIELYTGTYAKLFLLLYAL